ncbi:MAG TPA: DUF5715 family protein [Rhodothermales bacterium]|nr:DUF5715 family protein [Rhodothermales bacterium]
MRRALLVFSIVFLMAIGAVTVPAAWARVPVTLKGSPASMVRQHHIAEHDGFLFAETPEQIDSLVKAGKLIPVPGNSDYGLSNVSFPFARPEIRLFVERLAAQYYEGTGEKLVVTSLTRPTDEQPWNSHPLSVHPTGMAVDLRVSDDPQARAWLESVLLKLERQGLLDVTREHNPPHYHVALFPLEYRAHVESMIGQEALATALLFKKPEPPKTRPVAALIQQAAVSPAPKPRDEEHKDLWALAVALPLALAIGGLAYRAKQSPGKGRI